MKNKYYLIRENDEFELVIAYIETYKELLNYLGLKQGSFSISRPRKKGYKVNGLSVYIERYINDELVWTTQHGKKS